MCGDGSGKREITDFESPIEVDIDKKIPVLVTAHTALYDCINAVIDEMDYKQYAIQFGGKNDGQDGESKSWNATKTSIEISRMIVEEEWQGETGLLMPSSCFKCFSVIC